MIHWIDSLSAWDGTPPGILVSECPSDAERESFLCRMSAKALRLPSHRVDVWHGEDGAVLAEPLGAGLFLSAAQCEGYAAFAVAPDPVGVQMELARPGAAVPWHLFHPIEAAAIEPLAGMDRARAVARLWSLKQAYLKALACCFDRDPAAFVVQFVDGERALVTDPEADHRPVTASTIWRGLPGGWAAVSMVMLARPRR